MRGRWGEQAGGPGGRAAGSPRSARSSFQQRLSYTTLSDLALALLDGTVFEIVQGLLEIQHLTEKSLYNQRLRLQNEHRGARGRGRPARAAWSWAEPFPGFRSAAAPEIDLTEGAGLDDIWGPVSSTLSVAVSPSRGTPEMLSPTPRRDPSAREQLWLRVAPQRPIGPVPSPRCIRFPCTEPRGTLWALKTRPLEPHAGQNLLSLRPSQTSLQGWEGPPEPLPAGCAGPLFRPPQISHLCRFIFTQLYF